jgi:4-amino-4-deoxy-L-arabinose transferase-like glycosyltransferase
MRFLDEVRARRDALSLAVVLLIAAITRLGDLGVVQYRYDEGLLSGISQEIVAGRSFPLLGLHTTTGVPTSPVSLYVMAIPYLLSDSALFATAFIAVLNVIGTGLLWCLARRFTSPRVALAAGLIYAINPWAILASRKIWTPYFVSPFMIAAFLVGLYAFVEGNAGRKSRVCPPLVRSANSPPGSRPAAGLRLADLVWAQEPVQTKPGAEPGARRTDCSALSRGLTDIVL